MCRLLVVHVPSIQTQDLDLGAFFGAFLTRNVLYILFFLSFFAFEGIVIGCSCILSVYCEICSGIVFRREFNL